MLVKTGLLVGSFTFRTDVAGRECQVRPPANGPSRDAAFAAADSDVPPGGQAVPDGRPGVGRHGVSEHSLKLICDILAFRLV